MQETDIKRLGKVLVTGGSGFIGASLVRRLVSEGVRVRVLDNNSRGPIKRLDGLLDKIDYRRADVTDSAQVLDACEDIDTIFHLAAINGTENFYRFPEKVLEVGVKGALNTLDAAVKCKVSNYIVTSSSEVYQEPSRLPTLEEERINIPDVKNPRFSYSGSKIITELLALHYVAKTNVRTIICRPHNFYGPDMGFGHVIPQFITRMKTLTKNFTVKEIEFTIQGTGEETRAFCYIDDAVRGLLICALKGENRQIYNIGTEEEVSISDLVNRIGRILGLKVHLKTGERLKGGAMHRCPSIARLRYLGYAPAVTLEQGLKKTIAWYIDEVNTQEVDSKEEIIR